MREMMNVGLGLGPGRDIKPRLHSSFTRYPNERGHERNVKERDGVSSD
jgi:hypothetical protein